MSGSLMGLWGLLAVKSQNIGWQMTSLRITRRYRCHLDVFFTIWEPLCAKRHNSEMFLTPLLLTPLLLTPLLWTLPIQNFRNPPSFCKFLGDIFNKYLSYFVMDFNIRIYSHRHKYDSSLPGIGIWHKKARQKYKFVK